MNSKILKIKYLCCQGIGFEFGSPGLSILLFKSLLIFPSNRKRKERKKSSIGIGSSGVWPMVNLSNICLNARI